MDPWSSEFSESEPEPSSSIWSSSWSSFISSISREYLNNYAYFRQFSAFLITWAWIHVHCHLHLSGEVQLLWRHCRTNENFDSVWSFVQESDPIRFQIRFSLSKVFQNIRISDPILGYSRGGILDKIALRAANPFRCRLSRIGITASGNDINNAYKQQL